MRATEILRKYVRRVFNAVACFRVTAGEPLPNSFGATDVAI
jgi:hypothetical protein